MERTPKHAVKTEGTAFKPLFFVAVLLAVALAAACVKLNDQRQDSLDREAALSRQLVQMTSRNGKTLWNRPRAPLI